MTSLSCIAKNKGQVVALPLGFKITFYYSTFFEDISLPLDLSAHLNT